MWLAIRPSSRQESCKVPGQAPMTKSGVMILNLPRSLVHLLPRCLSRSLSRCINNMGITRDIKCRIIFQAHDLPKLGGQDAYSLRKLAQSCDEFCRCGVSPFLLRLSLFFLSPISSCCFDNDVTGRCGSPMYVRGIRRYPRGM